MHSSETVLQEYESDKHKVLVNKHEVQNIF